MKRLHAVSTLLILTACAAPITTMPTPSVTVTSTDTPIPSNTPPPTVTPTNTTTPTITPSPTGTATLTPTFGPSPTPSLTPPLSSWIEEDFLFGGPTVEGCELPCWQGLTPGVSTAEEVDQVFTQIFGYGRDYDTLEEVVATYAGYSSPLIPWAGQSWEYETDTNSFVTGPDRFSAAALLDRETYLLGAIRFRWAGLLLHYTPAMLIRELGEPSRFLIHISSYPQRGNRFMQFFLIYDEGIIYTAWMAFPEYSGGVEICLEGLYWNGQYDSWEREIVLITPIGDEFPIPAHEFLNPTIYKKNWASFEDKLGVPLAEVTETVQSDEPACWFYEGD